MKMIIGGAWQGKLDWAKDNCPEVGEGQWADGKDCPLEAIYCCGGIYDFQAYIRRLMKEEEEDRLVNLADRLIRQNPGLVIVSDEIGSGLVPVEKFDRDWREWTGRICTELAGYADQVIRVVMGIGIYIKGN